MRDQKQKPKNDREAIQTLGKYTGYYNYLAVAQYKLSRQRGESIAKSLDDARVAVFNATSEIIKNIE